MISPQNNRLKRVFSNFNPCFKDFSSIPVLLATAFRFCFHLDTFSVENRKIRARGREGSEASEKIGASCPKLNASSESYCKSIL